jgi:outer membrane protein
MPTHRPRMTALVFAPLPALLVALAGCASSNPLADDGERALRRVVEEAAFREITEAEQRGGPRTLTREDAVGALGIAPQFRPELDKMAGPEAYAGKNLPLGQNLLGTEPRTVAIGLERAVRTAVSNNIAVQFARLSPALGEARVSAAEAAFDWVLFNTTGYGSTDSPRTSTATTTTGTNQQLNITNTTGLRRPLIGGGRLTIQQELGHLEEGSVASNPNPAETLSWQIQYDQPLLKGMGSDVTQAEIRLARNAERNNVQTFKRDLLRTVADTEKTYWELVQAQQSLFVLERLLERGKATLEQLKARSVIDANDSQIADATARIARRRADLTRAQTNLKNISDRLKALMNDPDLPVGSEILVLPVDRAVDEPIRFSLMDSIRQGVLNRPEIQQAILSIDDSSIRRLVAENSRLPDLNLRLQTRLATLESSFGEAYTETVERNFIDYVVSLAFEMPLGNRRAESETRLRSLERMQAVIAYRNTVQQVTQEVKASLDRVMLNYALIDQTRASRIAAAEVLRVLEAEKATTRGVTPERLDLEMSRQESLAAAEQSEMLAMVEYNSAITDLFASMGTLLERNKIRFVVPSVEDAKRSQD